MTLDAACAHVARVARNKAVDLLPPGTPRGPRGRRGRRAAEAPADRCSAISTPSPARSTAATSRARCDELVRELPSAERRALTATASGAGYLGSGLARSSHYRALDRARLRLSAVVRSRVAAGLALPAVLLRTLGQLRGLALPAGATAAALIASVAFVLPALTPAAPAYARAALAPARPAQARRSSHGTAGRRPRAPARLVHRRAAGAQDAAVTSARPSSGPSPVRSPAGPRSTASVAPALPPPLPQPGSVRAAPHGSASSTDPARATRSRMSPRLRGALAAFALLARVRCSSRARAQPAA